MIIAFTLAALAAAAALFGAGGAPDGELERLREELRAPAIEGLLARTWGTILDRIEPDGYFEESLTGAYTGMFPRTVGGLASLLLEVGRVDQARRVIGAVLRAVQTAGMTRAPHVMGRRTLASEPAPGPCSFLAPDHPIALYRLDAGYGGAVRFSPPPRPIRAVEIRVTVPARGADLTVAIADTLDAPRPIARARAHAGPALAAGGWLRFRFARPVALPPGRPCFLIVEAAGASGGASAWWGRADAAGDRHAGGFGRDPAPRRWLDCPAHLPAFALDTGDLGHKRRVRQPIISRQDQPDGNFHVLAAWARAALAGPRGAWEDRTYPQVARLADTAIDWPYLTPAIARIWPGLVRNVCLEHSREGRYWDCWDILTQSWACQALRLLERAAARRGDLEHAGRWREARTALEQSVRDRLTMRVDGRLVYAEMRLPDGGEGRLFDGMSWLNLAPIPAGWEGADPAILSDTVAVYREKAALTWRGMPVSGTEWQPGVPVARQVIGKGVGWELAWDARQRDWASARRWLAFIAAANTAPIYAEAFNLTPDGAIAMQDPGNGEQVTWWCWGMARLRRAVDLAPMPDPVGQSH